MERLDYTPQGRLTPDYDLSQLTWLRVGGPADHLFLPRDADDLARFLAALPPEIAVFPMGVGSNLIVRDGGIRGVVIRLGRAFADFAVDGDEIEVGAAMLDSKVATQAAEKGRDLTFLRTIPGAIGGAIRMNAGCYGRYIADHFVSAEAVTRQGERVMLGPEDLNFRYRQIDLPPDTIILSARFTAPEADPKVLDERMREQLERRDATQPTKALTAGSTFRNPVGYSSTGEADDTHEMKAWSVIDAAGMRGATRGGAQMSEMHPNFLINTGDATAADLEGLGEDVRERVLSHSGISLEWEVMRVGEPAPEADTPD